MERTTTDQDGVTFHRIESAGYGCIRYKGFPKCKTYIFAMGDCQQCASSTSWRCKDKLDKASATRLRVHGIARVTTHMASRELSSRENQGKIIDERNGDLTDEDLQCYARL
jgi:hypothetical protein